MRPGKRATQRGFTYIGLLFLVALMGLALALAGTLVRVSAQRDREQQLLFVGHQFRDAIGRYYAMGRQLPQSLQDLLNDQRSPVPLHHLRRIYDDPMTGKADWELIRGPNGGIVGVASLSADREPLKQHGFDEIDKGFDEASCYAQWQFVYRPSGRPLYLMPPGRCSR